MEPGASLEALARASRHEMLLVAPFIKVNTLDRIMNLLSDGVRVQVVTRWRIDEIIAGVSDIDVWTRIKEHKNNSLWLRPDLHAKYYRGDHRAVIGSSNLTNTALGWSQRPNLELLVPYEPLPEFERQLFAGAVAVDDALYDYVRKIVDSLLTTEIDQTVVQADWDCSLDKEVGPTVNVNAWLPMLRHPEKLYTAYMDAWDKLGIGSREAAKSDLQFLDIPRGLAREQFEGYVGVQLLQMPIVRQVDRFIETPQRFGAVRDLLKSLPCAEREGFDADMAWQTLMRWMTQFLADRYVMSTPRYSEVISRIL